MSSHQPIVPNTRIPVTPIVTVQASAPVQSGSQEGRSAFDAHLQQAHRHHARASSSRDDGADPADDGLTGAAAADEDTATSASANASSSADDTTTSADKAADTDVSNTASLVRSVLGLIGQSAEETNGSSAATATKAEPNKPAAAAGEKPDTAPAPSASMLLAGPLARTNVLADAGTGDAPLSSVTSASGGSLFAGLGKADASGADAADSGGVTGDAAAGNSVAASAASLPALNPAALGQNAIGTILGSGHPTHGADTGGAGAQTTPAIRDLSALNGLLGTQGVGPSMGAPSTTAHSLTVNAPVNSPDFSSELGQQVAWLGGQDVKQAKILLHPQDLGQLNVNVSVAHGKVDVVFLAQHPNAVAAVQQSLDQLSQMLNNQGLSLGQATVGQQGAQQQANGGASAGVAAPGSAGDDGITDVATTPATQRLALGLVDAFA